MKRIIIIIETFLRDLFNSSDGKRDEGYYEFDTKDGKHFTTSLCLNEIKIYKIFDAQEITKEGNGLAYKTINTKDIIFSSFKREK